MLRHYFIAHIVLQNDEISLMRLFAHNHLGPRVYASFENGLAYEYTAGKCLDYVLAVEKNVYPLVARKVGTLHRLMSGYVGETIKTNDFNLLKMEIVKLHDS